MHILTRTLDARERRWRDATVPAHRGGGVGAGGIWQCDLADGALTWSPEVFALFGIAPGMRLDRRATVEMYTDESRALMERLRAEAIAERGSFTMEAQIRGADGALRWMRLTADVLCRDGRATHLYGAKQDITAEMTAAAPANEKRDPYPPPRESIRHPGLASEPAAPPALRKKLLAIVGRLANPGTRPG